MSLSRALATALLTVAVTGGLLLIGPTRASAAGPLLDAGTTGAQAPAQTMSCSVAPGRLCTLTFTSPAAGVATVDLAAGSSTLCLVVDATSRVCGDHAVHWAGSVLTGSHLLRISLQSGPATAVNVTVRTPAAPPPPPAQPPAAPATATPTPAPAAVDPVPSATPQPPTPPALAPVAAPAGSTSMLPVLLTPGGGVLTTGLITAALIAAAAVTVMVLTGRIVAPVEERRGH